MDCTIITPSIGSYGGASKSAMDLILACSQNTKKTTVIYVHKSKFKKKLDGYNVENLKKNKISLPIKLSKITLKELRRWMDYKIFGLHRLNKINKINSRIAIINSIAGDEIFKIINQNNYKMKILIIRESIRHFKYKFDDKNALENAKKIMLSYDKLIFVSDRVREEWGENMDFKKNQCYYIPNCIHETDTKKVLQLNKNYIRNKYNFKKNEYNIICVASLQYRKGQDIIIKILPELYKIIPEFKLHLVGPHIQPFASKLLNNKNFIKYKNHIKVWGKRKDIYKLIHASDLFLFPTRAEAFPRVILEAMSLKTPIVASEVDGISEMLEDNISGMLFQHNDYDKIINDLSLIYNDANLKNKLIKNAYNKYWNTFSRKQQIKRYSKFFEKININI